MPREIDYVTMDNYVVDVATTAAVMIKHRQTLETRWLPRSVCQDGDTLDLHDEDIVIARWFADKADLPYEL